MKKIMVFISLMLCVTGFLFAQKYTLSGYVVDAKSGETMIGVNVMVKGEHIGAATDGNGFYRVTGLDPGKVVLVFSYIGYKSKEIVMEVINRSLLLTETALIPEPLEQDVTLVQAERSEIADVEIEVGHRKITPQAIQSIPTSRNDVFRALKFLPGIEGVDPISPLYAVRGGDPGENLILLDGVTIYNPYHCVSTSGLFNLYAVKNVEMMVGGFGSEYGGRNSSVLYITTREGNNEKLHGEINPGLTNSNMAFDFPVGDKATMMVSGRVYYDLVSKFLFYSPNYFADMNVSYNWKINPKNRLSLCYFISRDDMDLSMGKFFKYFKPTFDTDLFDNYDLIYKNQWNNQAATAILKTVLSPQLYLKTQFSGSFFSSKNISLLDFDYTNEDEEEIKLEYSTDIRNKIRDIGGKVTLSADVNSFNVLTLGTEYNQYYFSNDIIINDFSEGETSRKPSLLAGFIEEKLQTPWFILRSGLRSSKYKYMKDWYLEPRFNLVVPLTRDIKLRAAWGTYYQYIISINSQEYELSQFLDYYYPLRKGKPSASIHNILGLDKKLNDQMKISVDFYYKDIQRVYTFDYNLSESEAYRFSDKINAGTGKAYGMEIMWQGEWHKLAGWISYGLGRSTRSYPHIMQGKEYLFDYDRTHTFKAMINHQVQSGLSYSGTLLILSGVPKSMEWANKFYYYYDPVDGTYSSYPVYAAPLKNNARLPLYIRLDLGLKKRIRKGFGAELAEFLNAKESYLNVTFGNLLFFYRNVWIYYPIPGEGLYGMGTNYFPEFSIGYTIKF
jgi:hypothetical protein